MGKKNNALQLAYIKLVSDIRSRGMKSIREEIEGYSESEQKVFRDRIFVFKNYITMLEQYGRE